MWTPSASFLNSRRARTESGHDVSWHFRTYVSRLYSHKIYECILTCGGQEAVGFGVAPTNYLAAIKAFAEAWERSCFMRFAAIDGRVRSTNGFAAGQSNETALRSSNHELIERSVMLLAWQNQIGWFASGFHSLSNRLRCFAYALKGWRLKVFDIKSNVGTVKACLAIHPKEGAVFDTAFSGQSKQDEEKVVMGVVKNIFLLTSNVNFEMPNAGFPEDHSKFYSGSKNLEAFDFLFEKSDLDERLIELPEIEKLESKIIHAAGMFPAVAYSSHTLWPELSWGQSSVTGRNKWPHPLA